MYEPGLEGLVDYQDYKRAQETEQEKGIPQSVMVLGRQLIDGLEIIVGACLGRCFYTHDQKPQANSEFSKAG